MNPITPSSREIIQSPIEIGSDEIVPYQLNIPASWGNASNPMITPDLIVSDGPEMQGARKILFTIDALNNLTPGEDCRVEIRFDIPDGCLECWGLWQCKQ